MPAHDPSPPQSPALPDWRELAHQASEEPDGKKVVEIVRKICDALDQAQEEKKKPLEFFER
jgi:hypothetical protein